MNDRTRLDAILCSNDRDASLDATLRFFYVQSTDRMAMAAEQRLLLSEPNCLFNGHGQLGRQCLVRLIGRQVQAIEACVSLGQLAFLSRLLDGEPTRTVRALQVLETIDRYP